ncbi:MAG: transposase [Polyangia bacterium]
MHPLFAAELHHKTLLSVHGALLGTLQAARAGVTLIGRGLACARGLRPKHAIKQVDRLLSNPRLDPIELTPAWVSYVLAQRTQIVVALDWTEFAEDGHSTPMLSLITKTGRATPLLWRSVPTENIQRIAAEDELIERLRAAVPEPVQITLLADRGFGSQPFYGFLEALGIDYVIRFKESTLVTSSDGKARPAREYVPASGRAQSIPNALVTEEAKPMAQVVCVRKKGMKQAWCLASSRGAFSDHRRSRTYMPCASPSKRDSGTPRMST